MSANNLLDELLEIAAPVQSSSSSSSVATEQPSLPVPVPASARSTAIQGMDEIVVPDSTPLSPQDDDIAFARKKMRNIIKAAEDAFNDLANIASETQQPRAYEVLATLLKTTTDATKELIATHKTKAEIKRIEQGGSLINTAYDKNGGSEPMALTQVNQTIEKAVFVGTAPELIEKLSSIQNNTNEENNNANVNSN